MVFDKEFIDKILEQASKSPRMRQNYDLRNSAADTSQRMMNALQPGTVVPIHCHEDTAETVICLCGKVEEIFYEEDYDFLHEQTSREEEVLRKKCFKETARFLLSPQDGLYGIQIPAGTWHTIQVLEPSVIFEAKDGTYIPR